MRLCFVVSQETEKATGKGLSWERRSPAPSSLLWLLYCMQPNKESAREDMVPTAPEVMIDLGSPGLEAGRDSEVKSDSGGWGDGLVSAC